jgi:hypothetical protein
MVPQPGVCHDKPSRTILQPADRGRGRALCRPILVAACIAVVVGAVWGLALREFRLDDSFITYRYAQNIADGVGFVYNPGERVLSTTAPLYALILVVGSWAVRDFGLLGNAVSAASMALGAWIVWWLLADEAGRWWGGLGAGLYATSALLWLSLGMETNLLLALVLAALLAATRGRWTVAGALGGVATLVRPDALVAVGLLALAGWLRERRIRWGYVAAVAAPVLAFAGWGWWYFGSPVPATLGAKGAQTALGITGMGPNVTFWAGLWILSLALVKQSPLYLAFVPLTAMGWLDSRRPWWATWLAAWAALHTLAYALLGVAPYRWYYSPLVPALAALATLGTRRLATRIEAGPGRTVAVGMAALALLGAQFTSLGRIAATIAPTWHGERVYSPVTPIVDWDAYRAAGEWLALNTPPDAVVGVAEVGQLGFYAERHMVDYLGLIRPDVAQALARRDVYWWLPAYEPDYLVFQMFRRDEFNLFGYPLAGDDWFWASYEPVATFDDERYLAAPVVIMARTRPRQELIERPVEWRVDERVTLVGAALDCVELREGETGRLRLDWRWHQKPPAEVRVAAAIVEGEGGHSVAKADRTFDASTWEAGEFSTFHTFVVGDLSETGTGIYWVWVSVWAGGEEPSSAPVTWAKVPLGGLQVPEDSRPVGAEFGGLIGLERYALEETRSGALLRLFWRGLQPIDRPYVVFVHLLDEAGEIAAQADGEPLGGAYPTFVWDVGELVSTEHFLRLDGLPPGEYTLSVGWYLRDGGRLSLPGGEDHLILASVAVSKDGEIQIAEGQHSGK